MGMEPFTHISPQEAERLPKAIFIDVRTESEHDQGHIKDSLLIPLGAPDFQAKMSGLDKNKPYLLYCRSGSRSGMAMMFMRRMGFTEVYNLSGGTIAWKAAGKQLTV